MFRLRPVSCLLSGSRLSCFVRSVRSLVAVAMSYPSLKEPSSSASANYSSTYRRRSCISHRVSAPNFPLPTSPLPRFCPPTPCFTPSHPGSPTSPPDLLSHTPLHTVSLFATPIPSHTTEVLLFELSDNARIMLSTHWAIY
ncbi:hypothetical protein GSI_00654 [Ganoderma sinense ZZ0214-1]|uniref:Uncharacterized protein n=1 Tax=Ganoderma sinense ZZ0214-1 TaxID=1077348 RepID=A0A2G8STA5_9APHY|nr:hypothetical protein GSI_00654 [Ganoderma sinense ZZ0214-1]